MSDSFSKVLLIKEINIDYIKKLEENNYLTASIPALSEHKCNIDKLVDIIKSEPHAKYWGVVLTSSRASYSYSEAFNGIISDYCSKGYLSPELLLVHWKKLYHFTVGPRTSKELREIGCSKILGENGNSEDLADFIINFVSKNNLQDLLKSHKLLFLVGDKTKNTIDIKLREHNIIVERLQVYETVPYNFFMPILNSVLNEFPRKTKTSFSMPSDEYEIENDNYVEISKDKLMSHFNEEMNPNNNEQSSKYFNSIDAKVNIDFIVFFSPSGVDICLPQIKSVMAIDKVNFVGIGKTTSQHLLNKGIKVQEVPESPTPDGLVVSLNKIRNSLNN